MKTLEVHYSQAIYIYIYRERERERERGVHLNSKAELLSVVNQKCKMSKHTWHA
jgi:hypothetical protein